MGGKIGGKMIHVRKMGGKMADKMVHYSGVKWMVKWTIIPGKMDGKMVHYSTH